MTKAAAIFKFWSSFGLDAWEETVVPTGDDAPGFPYITFSLATDSFGTEVAMSGSVWYRSTSWLEANAKADEIAERLGLGGIVIPCDGGAVWIKPGTPFAQNMADPSDEAIRRKRINITAEYITQY